jgi:aminopeptidase YwaD
LSRKRARRWRVRPPGSIAGYARNQRKPPLDISVAVGYNRPINSGGTTMSIRKSKNTGILWVGVTLLWLGAAPGARGQGTPAGHYATGQVDVRSYRYWMEEELYAHDGDDRGFGLEHNLCRDNIEEFFTHYGLDVTLHPFLYNGSTYYNVVGELRGTTRPGQIYVVAGHFDSVGNPGADDNASAVAALLEIARVVGRWRAEATIRLISFDREEQYLVGSQAYVNDFVGEDFRGTVSLDMISYSGPDPDKARIHGRVQSDPLKNALADAVVEYSGLQPYVFGENDRTDHAPFEWAGYEGCWFAEYDYIEYNPNYHKQTDSVDTPDYIDYDYGAQMTRSVLGWLVDAAGLKPTLRADAQVLPQGGGTIHFTLTAGAEYGGRDYFLLASASGTEPGRPLPGGGTLPLNMDKVSRYVLDNYNGPMLIDFQGTFDAEGRATATLDVSSLPLPAGTVLNFAYTTQVPPDFQSNPVAVEVIP